MGKAKASKEVIVISRICIIARTRTRVTRVSTGRRGESTPARAGLVAELLRGAEAALHVRHHLVVLRPRRRAVHLPLGSKSCLRTYLRTDLPTTSDVCVRVFYVLTYVRTYLQYLRGFCSCVNRVFVLRTYLLTWFFGACGLVHNQVLASSGTGHRQSVTFR